MELIAIGDWRNEFDPDLPDPRAFIDTAWDSHERWATSAHLS